MKYAPQLKWTQGDRAVSAACRHCRWEHERTTVNEIRRHALAKPGHRIVVTTRTETVVSTDSDVLVTVDA